MGLFDRLMGRKAEAPKSEQKLPPAMPEQKSALMQDAHGAYTLNPDAQYVTTKEAMTYVMKRFDQLKQELEDIQKSGLPESEKAQKIKANAAEGDRLKAFRERVEARTQEPQAKDQLYKEQQPLVENPNYGQKVETQTAEQKETTELHAEASQRAEQLEEELTDLMHRRDQLVKTRDELMKSLKESPDLVKQWEISGLKAHAKVTEQPVYYPNYFPADVEKADMSNEMKERAEKLEQEERENRKKLGQPLFDALGELEDVEAKISAHKRDLKMIEMKHGGDMKEAA